MKILNPIIPGTSPDPSICSKDGEYYLVTSSFQYLPGVPIYHSKDLKSWEHIGNVLTRKSQLDFSKNRYKSEIFAATIRYNNNTFYMITTDWKGEGNFYVTAQNPAGPWSDPIIVERTPKSPKDLHFDPSLLFDTDGTVYYTRRGTDGIDQAIIDINTGKLASKPKEISRGFCSWDIEGPHLYHIGKYYFLLAAEGGSRYGHMVTIGRSISPWGPFKSSPYNPLLTQRHVSCAHFRDTGHADMLKDNNNKWQLVFHATRNYSYNSFAHLGRESSLTEIIWTKDGWPTLPNNKIIIDPGAFTIPEIQKSSKTTINDYFKDLPIPKYYYTTYTDKKNEIFITKKDGLAILGSKYKLSDKLPTMIGIKQRQFNISCETNIIFNPLKNNDEAGLALYASPEYYYSISIKKEKNKKYCLITKNIGDINTVTKKIELTTNENKLKITGNKINYCFYLKINNKWHKIESALTRLLSPELSTSWTGVSIMMFAYSNTKNNKNKAIFKYLKYKDT